MISANKLKVRELTQIEKEKLLEFMTYMTQKSNKINLFISIILFLFFTVNVCRNFFMEDRPSIYLIIISYTILIIISFLPFLISFIKSKVRISNIKSNNVTGVRAMCPYGKNNYLNIKLNSSYVYEVITEFESRMVIEPTVYGNVISANTDFYVIRFGKKDTVFCNFDIYEE